MITNHEDNDNRVQAKAVHFEKFTFTIETSDGKEIAFPYSVSPRLLLASQVEREAGTLMPGGYGIEWDELNEHLSIDGLIHGKVSTETWRSVHEWYELRQHEPDVLALQNGHVVIA